MGGNNDLLFLVTADGVLQLYKQVGFINDAGIALVILMEPPLGIKDNQIEQTITELEEKRGWRTITGWSLTEAQRVLELVERNGILTVDRQMSPWIIRAKCTATDAWRNIYRGLI